MIAKRLPLFAEAEKEVGVKRLFFPIFTLVWIALVVIGCAHYPVNQPLNQVDPQGGYRARFAGSPGNSENLALYLTFSGGGTRAAALSYGVLEELRKTEVVIDGRKGDFWMRSMGYRVYPGEASRQGIMDSSGIAFLRILKANF